MFRPWSQVANSANSKLYEYPIVLLRRQAIRISTPSKHRHRKSFVLDLQLPRTTWYRCKYLQVVRLRPGTCSCKCKSIRGGRGIQFTFWYELLHRSNCCIQHKPSPQTHPIPTLSRLNDDDDTHSTSRHVPRKVESELVFCWKQQSSSFELIQDQRSSLVFRW